MERSRRKDIKRHLSEEALDELLREAEDDHRLRRLGFVKNLYHGDSIPEAADREGRSAATGDRWAEAWNEGGLEALMPNFGGGRPPKLDDDEQDALVEILRAGQPWDSQEIQRLLQEEFGVSYSPNYLGTVLRELGLSYVKSRPKRSHQSENPDEILDEDKQQQTNREGDQTGGWVVDDDVCTDGGTAVDRDSATTVRTKHRPRKNRFGPLR